MSAPDPIITEHPSLGEAAHLMQLAVHAALSTDPVVRSALGDPPRLHDDVPPQPQYPYLTYGEVRSTDTGADGAPQSSHRMTLNVWSRGEGRGPILALLRRIQAVLERDLPFIVIPVLLDVVLGPDGRTRRGTLTLTLILSNMGDAP